ncbi:AvrD family protein [Streptomyces achromogenes]|uniref:AvrD family protein n=1 Tax=Streptomyces achromogenes TaxID=67255 RepID=UPI0036FE3C87
MNSKDLFYGSLDSCLGPGSTRFFGSGYKRVVQDLRNITTDGSAEPGALATARGTLTYPQDWSRKSDAGELRPHLSSIDALVLAATLAEVHVGRAFGLTAAQQRRTWLRHADVRAGSRPHEDLADFPVQGRLLAVDRPDPEQPALTSTYDCRIGGLRVRCTLAHERGTGPQGPVTYTDTAEALGPSGARHYGEGYKHRDQHADRVHVDLGRQRVRGRQRVVATRRHTETRGAEAAYGPSVSLVDALVGVAQLAQVLLYAQDGLSRGGSDTLWMRRFVIGTHTPVRPLGRSFASTVRTAGTRLVDMAGHTWRTAELAVDDYAGIGGRCSLAHRLPSAAQGRRVHRTSGPC